ncbi:uncharacterized protein P884DRAFT_282904 [Thermothelomyces heterothallicus CBS 202.75]|uniref:uncharacterized protein n=1 Tax=Thermothelomyces heterothallicus CBS 202.75 TaxID=1149848 RepID=UPI003743E046
MLCPRSPGDGTARIDNLGSPPARAYHSPFHISNMSQFGRWADAGHITKAGKGTASDGVTRRLRPSHPWSCLSGGNNETCAVPGKGKERAATLRHCRLIKHVPRLPSVCGAALANYQPQWTFAGVLSSSPSGKERSHPD